MSFRSIISPFFPNPDTRTERPGLAAAHRTGCYRPVARCCFVFATGLKGGPPPKAPNELILFIPREIGIIGAQTLVRRGS